MVSFLTWVLTTDFERKKGKFIKITSILLGPKSISVLFCGNVHKTDNFFVKVISFVNIGFKMNSKDFGINLKVKNITLLCLTSIKVRTNNF